MIDAIKHNVEIKLKNCYIFLCDCIEEASSSVKNKTSLLPFVCFSGGHKYFIQNKREKLISIIRLAGAADVPSGANNPTTLWPRKIICHEMLWN